MSENVIYMIGEKRTGKVFNAKESRFENKITFHSFFPSRIDAEYVFDNIFDGDNSSFVIFEGEVIEFKDGQLTVAFDDFEEFIL